MSGRTSLKDIADAIGMSVSTVSLALAGDQRVSEKTRQNVREVAARLGYIPDPRLASIASGRFRHPGKPVCVTISTESAHWSVRLRQQAEAMGMSLRGIEGPIDGLVAQAVGHDAAALVLDRRGVDLALLVDTPIPVVLWEDEGPAQSPVDLVETCEWWTATSGAVERVRAAGYSRPAAILTPAVPRHWHDDIRLACVGSCGIPAMEHFKDEEAIVAFVDRHRPDALVIGVPTVAHILQRHGITLPLVSLIANDEVWFRAFAGWLPDQDHRGQVTLELIEQRLRYGKRSPRRIVIPPRWQDGTSLPIKA